MPVTYIDKSHTQTTRRDSLHSPITHSLSPLATTVSMRMRWESYSNRRQSWSSNSLLSVYLTLTFPVTLYPYCHLLYVLCTWPWPFRWLSTLTVTYCMCCVPDPDLAGDSLPLLSLTVCIKLSVYLTADLLCVTLFLAYTLALHF